MRLHFCENYWTASGKRKFNVFINGQKVLTNFDIYATAGTNGRAVIKEITKPANASGQLVYWFTNVVDNEGWTHMHRSFDIGNKIFFITSDGKIRQRQIAWSFVQRIPVQGKIVRADRNPPQSERAAVIAE